MSIASLFPRCSIPYTRGCDPINDSTMIIATTGRHHQRQQQVRTVRVQPEATTTPTTQQRVVYYSQPPAPPSENNTLNVGSLTPETFKRRYGYYPAGYVTPSAVDLTSDTSSQAGGVHPKEFVKVQDEKMALPQVMM